MRKFATVEFMPQQIVLPNDLTKRAARKLASEMALPEQLLLPGKVLFATRAISNRVNDNGDFFSADELHGKHAGRTAGNDEYGYRTFIGKPVFLDHNNSAFDDPRGRHIAALIFDDPWDEKTSSKYPRLDFTEHEGTDTWIKLFGELDADRYPRTAEALKKGLIRSTSMGCDVEFSKCSICDNKATSTHEYCKHIGPGQKLAQKYALDDGMERYAYERNHGLTFFENSLLTVPPADPSADILSVVASENQRKDTVGYELTRQAGESVDSWMDRRSEFVKAAFRTQVSFAKVARRDDVIVSQIDRRTALSGNRKSVTASAENGQFSLYVTASHPRRIWIKDAKGNEAFYGEAKLAPVTAEDLKREFKTNDFKSYASALFDRLEGLQRRANLRRQAEEGNERVQEKAPVDMQSEPVDPSGSVDHAQQGVMEHAPAPSLGVEPGDGAGSPLQTGTVQMALPPEYQAEALESSDAHVDPSKEDVVMAKKVVRLAKARRLARSKNAGTLRSALAELIKAGASEDEIARLVARIATLTGLTAARVLAEVESDEESGDSSEDDDEGEDEDSDSEDAGEEDEESESKEAARKAFLAKSAAPGDPQEGGSPTMAGDGGEMEKSPSVNVMDKGMTMPPTPPAWETPQEDVVSRNDAAPSTWVPPQAQPTVEDAGLQRPIEEHAPEEKMARKFAQAVERRVAAQTEKIWDCLSLANHKVRLGQLNADRMLVEARKLFDETAHSDVKAQIKVYAELTRKEASLAHRTQQPAGRAQLSQPIMTKVAAARQQSQQGDVAFNAAFLD